MSYALINRSPDLKRLRDEGYELEIRAAYLLIHHVPYVNSKRLVQFATLASELTLAGGRTARPSTHVALFTGDEPCDRGGKIIRPIQHGTSNAALGDGLVARWSFSNKPAAGYVDYYEKMTRYIAILSAPARALDPTVTATTYKVVPTADDSVFQYLDTASSRAGILAATEKLAQPSLAIVGLGGTGGYVLDLVAKTPVQLIHLFDGDDFLQHNAFRAPGAPSLEALERRPKKVDYYADVYGRMHKGIIAHPYYITAETVDELRPLGFVFLCMDKGAAKHRIIQTLEDSGISYIDVGIGVELADGALIGVVRVTTSTSARRDVRGRINLSDTDDAVEYAENIQIADLNALNAALAVIKWKKLTGFYHDHEGEHQSTYSVNSNLLTSDDRVRDKT